METVFLGIIGFAVAYGLLVWALYFARKKGNRPLRNRIAGDLRADSCDWSPVYGSCACGARVFHLERERGTIRKEDDR